MKEWYKGSVFLRDRERKKGTNLGVKLGSKLHNKICYIQKLFKNENNFAALLQTKKLYLHKVI